MVDGVSVSTAVDALKLAEEESVCGVAATGGCEAANESADAGILNVRRYTRSHSAADAVAAEGALSPVPDIDLGSSREEIEPAERSLPGGLPGVGGNCTAESAVIDEGASAPEEEDTRAS
jgi:hypothetical protein